MNHYLKAHRNARRTLKRLGMANILIGQKTNILD